MRPPSEVPRTVLRVPGGAVRPSLEVFERLAEPVLAYAERLASIEGEDQAGLLRHGATLLDRFAAGLQRAGAPGLTVPPARLALALILDNKARSNRYLDVNRWAEQARSLLFEGRDLSTGQLADFVRRADAAGPESQVAAQFLAKCLAQLETERRQFTTTPTVTNWTGIMAVLVTSYLLAVVGWVAYVEWRFHSALISVFAAEALDIGLDRTGDIPDLAARLDQMARAVTQVKSARARAPVTLFAGPLGLDAGTLSEAAYSNAVQRHVPAVLAAAVDRAFASEGDPVRLYDTLRAWRVLSGQSAWSPSYLSGWAADRTKFDPALRGLSVHVALLTPPQGALPAPDAELLDQARNFAAEAAEADRAYLELLRTAAVTDLPAWRGDLSVPGLTEVMVRKSGALMADPIAGLFTQAGWNHARDFGAGLAVQAARDQAGQLFSIPLPTHNDTADLLMDRLQRETLQQWSDYLADLRVQSFTSPQTSVLISGQLAFKDSPLEQLLQVVWVQAGGADRSRTHPQQLLIAAEFGPMIQYVEQGRMDEIAALFAGLNVALGAMDRDEDTGQQRLMSLQERAASIAALGQAPRVVVQIVEDTLAQTGAAHADLLSNPLTKVWQTQVLQTCQAATGGLFPFVAEGVDADPAAVAQLLAPGGVIDSFLHGQTEAMLDTSETPWRWKPEARFAGLSPESAVFLQRSQALTAGLFGPDGAMGATMTLSALAERGKASITIGGQGGPVQAATDSLILTWPGQDPSAGIEASFQTANEAARLAEPGPWGLFRLLGPLRLRERDSGKRFLVDLRSGGARLFLEISFDRPQNPLAMRGLLKGFTCPAVL